MTQNSTNIQLCTSRSKMSEVSSTEIVSPGLTPSGSFWGESVFFSRLATFPPSPHARVSSYYLCSSCLSEKKPCDYIELTCTFQVVSTTRPHNSIAPPEGDFCCVYILHVASSTGYGAFHAAVSYSVPHVHPRTACHSLLLRSRSEP